MELQYTSHTSYTNNLYNIESYLQKKHQLGNVDSNPSSHDRDRDIDVDIESFTCPPSFVNEE